MSADAARKSAQCHLVFAKLGIRHNWRADPLVRAGRPRPAFLSKNQALATFDKPARGQAADESLRHYLCRWAELGKLSGIAHECVRHIVTTELL